MNFETLSTSSLLKMAEGPDGRAVAAQAELELRGEGNSRRPDTDTMPLFPELQKRGKAAGGKRSL